MGIFSGLFKSRDKPVNRTPGSSFAFYMGGSSSGKIVNERSAMQMTAVYACVRILSEAIAGLPLHLYRYKEDGGKEKATGHPLYLLLHDEPNPEMSSFVFRETLMTHLLLYGNAYAQIIRNGKGEIVGLYLLMANKMNVNRDTNGQLYYQYQRSSDEAHTTKGDLVVLMPSDVLHIPGLGFDGLVGYSPIAMAKNAIGFAIATEEYGSKFFANGAAPSGVLEHPGTIKDPAKVRDAWMSQFGGSSNSGKIAVLEEGMEGFLNTHRNDMGVLSAEDDATYSKMEVELDALTNEVKRMERRDAHEAELNKPMSEPLTAAPEKTAQMDRKSGRASDAYKEDFDRHLRGKTLLHNVLSTSPDVDGGFLVPTDFEHNIVTALDEENVIRRLAMVITTHHERKIPVAVGHSTAQWTAENAAYTESNPTFGQKQIDAFKLTDLCRVSVELLQDSEFDIEDYLIREFARAFGIAEEQAFCVGTGTNQPTGIFTANGGTVGVTAASQTGITADEVISLVYSLKSPYRRNAKFLMNDATYFGFGRSRTSRSLPASTSCVVTSGSTSSRWRMSAVAACTRRCWQKRW